MLVTYQEIRPLDNDDIFPQIVNRNWKWELEAPQMNADGARTQKPVRVLGKKNERRTRTNINLT